MENREIAYFEEQLGISTDIYQRRSSNCVEAFLTHFSPSPKSERAKMIGLDDVPVRIRVMNDPPSVQIQQFPEGGVNAGISRIRQKLTTFIPPKSDKPILLPQDSLVTAKEQDLTRECIILTLRDDTISKILNNGLLSPAEVAEIIHLLKEGSPHFFIVVQRYIIGIEQESGLPVPFRVVERSDERTFGYLEGLPELLAA